MLDRVSLTGADHRIKQDALLILFDLVIHACQLGEDYLSCQNLYPIHLYLYLYIQ